MRWWERVGAWDDAHRMPVDVAVAVVGAVIGTVYGWVGARTVMNQIGRTPFAVAWREVAIVVVVAVAAGLAASVLPARSAVRTSPVEALAVE